MSSRIQPAFEDFYTRLRTEISSEPKPDRSPSTIEPNFLLFRADARYVLAMCDSVDRVNTLTLYGQNESSRRLPLATPIELETIGFDQGFVHPIFDDPDGIIRQLFIDSALVFQLELQPQSLIRLPLLLQGQETKLEVPICSFFEWLYERESAGKIIYKNITKRKYLNETITGRSMSRQVHTRFAPSPSNGLHLGNVRAALIPYLLYSCSVSRGTYTLRFDDTKTASEDLNNYHKQIIRNELSWLGIEPQLEISQSTRDKLYRRILADLLAKNLASRRDNGEITLISNHPSLNNTIYLDAVYGVVSVPVPPGSYNKFTKQIEEASLLLASEIDNEVSFKYKFTGAVDDLFMSTHVVRDIRQRDNLLTARQALIIQAIRVAYGLEAKQCCRYFPFDASLVDDFELGKLRDIDRSVPLPVYIHIPVVVDHEGQPLRKRGAGETTSYSFTLEALRNRNVLPESVISYILTTIVIDHQSVIDSNYISALAGRLGVTGVLNWAAGGIANNSLLSTRQSIPMSHRELLKHERNVIRAMTLTIFTTRLEESLAAVSMPLPSYTTVSRAFNSRSELTSWQELVQLFTYPINLTGADLHIFKVILNSYKDGILDTSVFQSTIRSKASLFMYLRLFLTGKSEGMPLSDLIAILHERLGLILTGLTN